MNPNRTCTVTSSLRCIATLVVVVATALVVATPSRHAPTMPIQRTPTASSAPRRSRRDFPNHLPHSEIPMLSPSSQSDCPPSQSACPSSQFALSIPSCDYHAHPEDSRCFILTSPLETPTPRCLTCFIFILIHTRKIFDLTLFPLT